MTKMVKESKGIQGIQIDSHLLSMKAREFRKDMKNYLPFAEFVQECHRKSMTLNEIKTVTSPLLVDSPTIDQLCAIENLHLEIKNIISGKPSRGVIQPAFRIPLYLAAEIALVPKQSQLELLREIEESKLTQSEKLLVLVSKFKAKLNQDAQMYAALSAGRMMATN